MFKYRFTVFADNHWTTGKLFDQINWNMFLMTILMIFAINSALVYMMPRVSLDVFSCELTWNICIFTCSNYDSEHDFNQNILWMLMYFNCLTQTTVRATYLSFMKVVKNRTSKSKCVLYAHHRHICACPETTTFSFRDLVKVRCSLLTNTPLAVTNKYNTQYVIVLVCETLLVVSVVTLCLLCAKHNTCQTLHL